MKFHRLLAACGSVFLLLPACKSASTGQDVANSKDPKPIGDLVERSKVETPIGKLLAELDLQIRAWTRLKMTAATAEDRTKARELEKVISTTAHERRTELIDQLQTGPLDNRIVAEYPRRVLVQLPHRVQDQQTLLRRTDDVALREVVTVP